MFVVKFVMQKYTDFLGVNWFNLIQFDSIWFKHRNRLKPNRRFPSIFGPFLQFCGIFRAVTCRWLNDKT